MEDFTASSQGSTSSRDYSAIGKGPLSLNGEGFSGYLSMLSHEISFLPRNSRPDAPNRGSNLEMKLKGSLENKKVAHGEKLYLQALSDKSSYELLHFSESVTAFWVVPYILEGSSILIEAGIGMEEGKERTAQLILDQPVYQNQEIAKEGFFQNLSSAKWWGRDLLVQQYGGGEYAAFKDKQKIEFEAASSYTLFVAAGDYIVWKNNQWNITSLDEANTKLPLALIKEVNASQIEIEVWDVNGYHPLQIKLALQSLPKMTYKLENLPSSFRLRTSTQVTCLFGKRRVILKQGDWLFKTSSGWHILKTLSDVNNCLNHKMRGELFIFDSLEKMDGKIFLKGNLFNEMRNQKEEIVIPILKDKKSKPSRIRKKHILSKPNTVSSSSEVNNKNEGL